MHDGTAKLYEIGGKATPGLEKLAEGGAPELLLEEISKLDGVSAAGIVGTAALAEGQAFPEFGVTFGSDARYFNVVSALSPANDAFFSLVPVGIEIVDAGGTPIGDRLSPDMVLADAGTETGQGGAIGPDMI